MNFISVLAFIRSSRGHIEIASRLFWPRDVSQETQFHKEYNTYSWKRNNEQWWVGKNVIILRGLFEILGKKPMM